MKIKYENMVIGWGDNLFQREKRKAFQWMMLEQLELGGGVGNEQAPTAGHVQQFIWDGLLTWDTKSES